MSVSSTLPEITDDLIIFYGNSNYAWPVPGYTKISSYFGKRNAPTSGASTYHKGIDIPAPEGTILIASYDGKITFTGSFHRVPTCLPPEKRRRFARQVLPESYFCYCVIEQW